MDSGVDLRYFNRFVYTKANIKDFDFVHQRGDSFFVGTRRVVFLEDKQKELGKMWDEPSIRILGRDRFFRSLIAPHIVGITVKDVSDFLKKHESHQLHRALERTPIVRPISEDSPLKRIQVDLIDLGADASVVHANQGYVYVMTCVDVYSRYLWCFPLKKKEAGHTAEALAKLFETSKPEKIQCDNGGEFAREFAELCAKEGVRIIHSLPHMPRSQGLVERTNGVIKRLLFLQMTERQTKVWVKYLPNCVHAYNSTFHSSIKTTPEKAINGTASRTKVVDADRKAKHHLMVGQKDDIEVGMRVRKSLLLESKERAKTEGLGRKATGVNWTTAIFKVRRVNRHRDLRPTTYILEGETKAYYRGMLQPIPDEMIPVKEKEVVERGSKKVIVGRMEPRRKEISVVEDVPVVRLYRKKNKKYLD